jgi:hypothetical protein
VINILYFYYLKLTICMDGNSVITQVAQQTTTTTTTTTLTATSLKIHQQQQQQQQTKNELDDSHDSSEIQPFRQASEPIKRN